MKGLARSCYVRVVILFFSVATTSTAKHIVDFSNEDGQHNEDTLHWNDSPPIKQDTEDNSKLSFSTRSTSTTNSLSSSWSKLQYSLFTNDDEYKTQLKEERLCDIGDGYIYRENESILTFETRCGSIEEFPCKCAPDLDPPISCPYCGFHGRKQHSTSNQFFCLEDGQISDPFVGRGEDGAPTPLQQCYCTVAGNMPVSTCRQVNGQERLAPKPLVTENAKNENNPAVSEEIQMAPMTKKAPPIQNTMNGNDPVAFTEESGKEWIIFNDIGSSNSEDVSTNTVESQREWTIINDIGSSSSEDESMYIDESGRKWTIITDIGSSTSEDDPIENTMDENDSIPSEENKEEVNSGNGIPSVISSTPIGSMSTNGGPKVGEKDDICTLVLDSGETKSFQRGESYGSFLPNECNRPSEFPCKCNPDLPNQIECPHCSFQTATGDRVCAKHQQTVSFLVPDSETRDVETCTCFVADDPTKPHMQVCSLAASHDIDPQEKDADNYYGISNDGAVNSIGSNSVGGGVGASVGGSVGVGGGVGGSNSNNNSSNSNNSNNNNSNNNSDKNAKEEGCKVTDPVTGEDVIIPLLESFADYVEVEGICGNGIDWPAFCTPDIANHPDPAIIQEPTFDPYTVYIGDRKDITYPYCIFQDTLSGVPVCARDMEQIGYMNNEEEEIQCSCEYHTEGGAISTCDNKIQTPKTRSSGDKVSRSEKLYPTYSPVVSPTGSPPPTIQVPPRKPKRARIGNVDAPLFIVYMTLVATAILLFGFVLATVLSQNTGH